jgi:hypothetical protein
LRTKGKRGLRSTVGQCHCIGGERDPNIQKLTTARERFEQRVQKTLPFLL